MPDKNLRKNISRKILDVFHPQKNDLNEAKNNLNANDFKFKQEQEKELKAIFNQPKNEFINLKPNVSKSKPEIWLILILIFLIGTGFFYFKKSVNFSLPKVNINTEETSQFLKEFNFNIEDKKNFFDSFWAKLQPLLSVLNKNIFLNKEFLQNANVLLNEVNNLSNNFPQIFLGESNFNLKESFLKIAQAVNFFNDYFNNFKMEDIGFNNPQFFDLKTEINRFANFLNNFIDFMNKTEKHHFLVFFANTSEMRPGGGFWGSYAEIKVTDWKFEKIKVLDINDPDKEFNEKIIPPEPLQNILLGWKAADANWFFDFNKSAEKT
ncbi:MAG: hypothetical protein ACPL3E_01560, partial [Minisyncoccia bacterium]